MKPPLSEIFGLGSRVGQPHQAVSGEGKEHSSRLLILHHMHARGSG